MSKIEKLSVFLAKYSEQNFETGVNDCALFVANWVMVLTGEDLAAPFRGQYSSDLGSARLMKRLGYQNLEDLAYQTMDRIAKRRASPLEAKRGDVAWVRGGKENLCGIVGPSGVVVLGVKGLIELPLHRVDIAWEVNA